MKSKKSSKSSGSKKSLRKKVLQETISVEVNENDIPSNALVDADVDDRGEINDEHKNINNNNSIKNFEEFEKMIMCDKSTAPSPTHSIISCESYNSNWARERELENTNENLHEKLKDTEERLQSLRIQYDSLSQAHRVLRENNSHVQEECDKLKIDHQILTECANVLR
jgi:hypothetical protein